MQKCPGCGHCNDFAVCVSFGFHQVLLLLGQYCEETASWESNAIVRQYKEVTTIHPAWEDGFFSLAKYYDKIMNTLVEIDRPEKKGYVYNRVHLLFGMSR